MTASSPDRRLRARLRRLTSAAAAFALAAGLGAIASPAMAADGDDETTDAGVVELSVAIGSHGRITPGASATASLALQNDTDARLSSGTVTVEINRTPLTDGAAVSTWLDETSAPGEFETLGSKATDAVDAGGSDRITVDLAPESLADLAPGVYPIRAGLSGASTGALDSDDLVSRNVAADSVLVVTADAVQVGVIVPITATPADGVLLTADELTELTAADGELTAALDGVSGTAAVIAIDPAIIAAIRVLGTAAPANATDWLERFDDLPNERFALQFGDADVTVQAQAQLPELLQPTTLAPFLNPLSFPSTPSTPTPTPGSSTPSPTPTVPDAPVLPDDEELTAVDDAIDGIVWPLAGARSEDLATFTGYFGGEVTTIVSSAATDAVDTAHATADGHDLLVIDDAISAAISGAAAESASGARQRWLAAASAQLYFAGQATPQAPLLVGLDRDETRDAAALREAIAAVDSPGFDLSAVRSAAASPVTLVAGAVDDLRVNALQNMLVDEGTLATFATILDDPQVLLSRERIRVLREIAVGVPETKFSTNVAVHRAATNDTLHAVSIPPSSTIQLLSANADLPFSVRNDLPWPVNLRLTVAPTDPRLEVQGSNEVVVQANSSARVKVPVSARVGSGELDLRLNLYSPTGVLIDGPQTVRVAVRAEWETIGLIIFGGLAVLLIVGGVIRTVLRRRRESADESNGADASAEAEADADTHAGEKETT
jgi:hypothetical protein